jgi:hypothetical protein
MIPRFYNTSTILFKELLCKIAEVQHLIDADL